MSALTAENKEQLETLANELCQDYIAKSDTLANKNDMTALIQDRLWSVCGDIQ